MLKKRIITTMLWNGETLVKGNQFINSRRAGSAITTIKIYNSRDVDEIVFFDINKNDSKDNYDLDFIRQLQLEEVLKKFIKLMIYFLRVLIK